MGGGVRGERGLGLRVDVPKMRVLVEDPDTGTSGFLEKTKH